MVETKAPDTANPGYALGQLAHALRTAATHEDAATRARADAKVAQWTATFEGMMSGRLTVGSRTPVADTPPWVTLEVLRGGFASGAFSAGGPLRAHESERLALRSGAASNATGAPAGSEREALNLSYLDDAGLAELQAMLASGAYRVEVPEEGALLAVAWLLGQGQRAAALELLDHLRPFFGVLRFYPVPHPEPLAETAVVRRQTIADTISQLEALRPQRDVEVMNEALAVWNPLADRAVSLVLETVDGAPPRWALDADGRPRRRAGGAGYEIEGGWPFGHYPAGWTERARALLEEYAALRARHQLATKPDRRKESFAELRRVLAVAVAQPGAVSRRDAGLVRALLAGIAAKRGLPGAPEHARLRATQARDAARPTRGVLREVLVNRLAARPTGGGLTSTDEVLTPVTGDEAAARGLPDGTALPAELGRRLERCVEAPVEVLVERGVLPSPEVLGLVVPQLTAHVRAASVRDPALKRLYASLYLAFRRRRSLLLLDLSHQVRLEELPWVAALEAHRGRAPDAEEVARGTLTMLVGLTLRFFPHVILPNKLLTELGALAKAAGLDLPLVEELAADIYQGQLSDKFLRAAKIAARVLSGTVYERYYDARFAEVLALEPSSPLARGRPNPSSLAALCERRAAVPETARYSVARNGCIVEQGQVLTTHNLAVLFDALPLRAAIGVPLTDLARRSFQWILAEHGSPRTHGHAKLLMLKNTAYAWRQMVFYLALAGDAEARAFGPWASAQLAAEPPALAARLRPVVDGLLHVLDGGHLGAPGAPPRLLGWTTGPHVLG